MTNQRKFSLVASCAALAGLGLLATPTSAQAQCYSPVYAPVTYVDYAPAVVPARTVYVSQPVYVSRPVYVPPPVYVAPAYKSRSFNLSLSFGNNSFRYRDGYRARRNYSSGVRYRSYNH